MRECFMSLVDALVNDPNASFSEEDVKALEQMSPELLQKIALLSSSPRSESESNNSAEAALWSELKECQENIVTLVANERDIRKELEAYGATTHSVLEKINPVFVANQADGGIDEDAVMHFIYNSKSHTAEMLREGIDARQQGRNRAVQTIMQAANNAFTQTELDNMPTPNLLKLASVLRSKRQDRFETPVYNWEGTAIADRSVGNSGCMGAPLDVLPTSPVK